MTPDQLKTVVQDLVTKIFNAESAVPAGATTTSDYICVDNMCKIGSIMTTTSSTYVGTTATVALYASNDNVGWAAVLQDDNVTACSFTLTAASTSYSWQLKTVVFKYYRILYTKGDASAGTLTSVLVCKK